MQIVQIGAGAIGRELARQLISQHAALQARYGLDLRYRAIFDRRHVLYTGSALDVATLTAALDRKASGGELSTQAAFTWLDALPNEPAIIVDVTAADGVEVALVQAVNAGHRVVLANKRPVTADLAAFQSLTAHGATRYEATAGAGLPVISTLQSLIDSGDSLLRVEAAMSGTLGYLCSELEQGVSFSAAVRTAHKLGYTEPDPRDDLSGADVARKALILARTAGLAWPAGAISGEPLYPSAMADLSVGEFLEQLPSLDTVFAQRLAEAQANDEVLRYVATVTPEGASVGLRALPKSHPLASLRGPDNLFSFTTSRYAERPLVVRGPGAGVQVTAAGVLGDIVACARESLSGGRV